MTAQFRSVVVLLECGCERRLSTGMQRLTADRVDYIVSHAIRTGLWCSKHGGTCQVVKYLRTERT